MSTNDFSIRAEHNHVFTDKRDVYTIGPDGDGKFAVRKNGEYIPGGEVPVHASLALRDHGLSLTTLKERQSQLTSARKSGYDQAREEIRENIIEAYGNPKPDQVQQLRSLNEFLDKLGLPGHEPKRTFKVIARDPGNGEIAFELTVIADDEGEAQEIAEELVTFNSTYDPFTAVEVDISDANNDDRVVSVDMDENEASVDVADLVDEWLKSLRWIATEEL